MNRRDFLKMGFLALGALFSWRLFFGRGAKNESRWQIDTTKCTQCGQCATNCVLPVSAVKCVHLYASCGYCDFCSGYYQDSRIKFDSAAENQRCPTSAIKRTLVEDPYFEYQINEKLCIGCGKCVKGCAHFGNGSLILQVKHDLCKNCNECRIAQTCPAKAFRRVSADNPYLVK